MSEQLIFIAAQVSATLLLGAFFGLERRMRGYPDASELHAIIAALGLVAMLLLRPEQVRVVTIMAAAMGICFVLIAGARAGLQALAGSRQLFATSGADTFTLTGAMSAGCACGTGDVRSVAGVMLLTALFSMFRPLETYAGTVLAHGNVDAASPVVVVPHAANDDYPPGPDARGAGGDQLH